MNPRPAPLTLMMHRLCFRLVAMACLAALWCAAPARAVEDRFFTTSDGVRLHYLDAGIAGADTLVFVPGWTMPAWIWQRQIDAFSARYHVVALDPRGQGESEIPPRGYEPGRRGADIGDLIAALGGRKVVLVGWSLGVLDSLAYVHEAGDARLAGLVLLDNSVGENPPPRPAPPSPRAGRQPPLPLSRPLRMRRFVETMFRRSPGEAFLGHLTSDALRTPPAIAAALRAYPVPRSYWREAVYSVGKPVLYVVTPRLAGQAENLAAHDPEAETAVFTDAGHALFVDDAERFNAMLRGFLERRVWPVGERAVAAESGGR
jgi:non-heme chloroperoxidase